ncbi:MAG: hypothetical protein LBH59_07505 [Planctomycetaceae bacterium]|nr:hypothetical protein [Planctomycetaceae bacterium]
MLVIFISDLQKCLAEDVTRFESFKESAILMRKILTGLPSHYVLTKNFIHIEQEMYQKEKIINVCNVTSHNLIALEKHRENMILLEQLKKMPSIGDDGLKLLIEAQITSYKLHRESNLIQLFQSSIVQSNWQPCFIIIMQLMKSHLRDTYLDLYRRELYNFSSIVTPLNQERIINYKSMIDWAPDKEPQFINTKITSLDLESIGLYDLAWRMQLEEGHLPYDNPNFKGKFNDSMEHHSFYLRVANTAYRSGNRKLGWSFLMNAAVLEDEQSFKKAIQLAQIWSDVEAGKKKLPEQKILTGKTRKQTFLKIVDSFQKMRIHPRAWLFVQENKNEFDDADGLIKKIQDDWTTFIKRLTNIPTIQNIVMHGVELYPTKNDPLSVKIPFPFSEDSFEKMKTKIQEIANKIKKDEKDDLINWRFINSKLIVKAKYISCNDKNEIIVEKENGKQERIEIVKLADDSKNYVFRRLVIRNMAIEDFCTLFHKWNLMDEKLGDIEAKYLLLDEENKITLELKDNTKQIINLSDLNKTEQECITIWESWKIKERERLRKLFDNEF